MRENMVFCNECGAKNVDGVKFCSGCGGKIGMAQPEQKQTKQSEPEEEQVIDEGESEFILPDKINVLKSSVTSHEFFENIAVENERKKPKQGLVFGIGGSSEEEKVEYTRYMNIPYVNVFYEYEDRISVKKGFMSSETRVVEKDSRIICRGNPPNTPPYIVRIPQGESTYITVEIERVAEASVRNAIDTLISQGMMETKDSVSHGTLSIPGLLTDLRGEILKDTIRSGVLSIPSIPQDLYDRMKITKTDLIFYPMYVAYLKSNLGTRRWVVFDGITGQKDQVWTRHLEESGGYIRDMLKESMQSGRTN